MVWTEELSRWLCGEGDTRRRCEHGQQCENHNFHLAQPQIPLCNGAIEGISQGCGISALNVVPILSLWDVPERDVTLAMAACFRCHVRLPKNVRKLYVSRTYRKQGENLTATYLSTDSRHFHGKHSRHKASFSTSETGGKVECLSPASFLQLHKQCSRKREHRFFQQSAFGASR